MTKRRLGAGLLLGAIALGVAVWSSREALLLHLPGWIGRLRGPIGANVAVRWEPGPPTASAPPAQRPPNIIVILADDLGYNDLTFGGGGVADGKVPTPNIDSIAKRGIEFTHGYAGNATCAPSRAASMTGRFPTRFGFEFTPAPKAFMRLVAHMDRDLDPPPVYFEDREKDVPPLDQEGLRPTEITIAELLRSQGYRTLGLGKWHLGEAKAMRPEAQGFDESSSGRTFPSP